MPHHAAHAHDPNRSRAERGPFDVIGDVHGCAWELESLLEKLGYAERDGAYRHADGRRAVFVGDFVDRGPDVPRALEVALDMIDAGTAFAVPGNHDEKFRRYLMGRHVRVAHGLDRTIEQLGAAGKRGAHLERRFTRWFDATPWHLVLDDGRLVVAHAGLPERLFGATGDAVRSFALYGDVAGMDAEGLPIRRDWARRYDGDAFVAYGHTPAWPPRVVNGTANVDGGCVFGGWLVAMRYPELEFKWVASRAAHAPTSVAFRAVLESHGRPGVSGELQTVPARRG